MKAAADRGIALGDIGDDIFLETRISVRIG
jgi:hypothetical protein